MGNIVISAFQLLAGQLDVVVQVIGGLLVLLLCGAIWWHRRQRAANKLGMASWYFIAPCLVVAALAIAAAAFGIGLRSGPVMQASNQPVSDNPSQSRPVFDNSGTTDIGGATFNGTPPPGFVKNEGTFSGRNMTVNVPQSKPLVFFSWTDETRALSTAELISRLNVVTKELRERNNVQEWTASAHRGRDLVGAAVNFKNIKLENIGSGALAISLVHIPNKAVANEGADFLNTIVTALAAKK